MAGASIRPESSSMRQIILDTETTGLDPDQGHRIIEFAGLEMINRKLTGQHLHLYIHPERDIDPDAERVHGISLASLEGKPRFAQVAEQLADFMRGAELIIHNAPFDVKFLNAEFDRLGLPRINKLAARSPTPWPWRATSSPASVTAWTPCATALILTAPTVPCTAR
jgi:DNA polymerase-3 subunit epsilon